MNINLPMTVTCINNSNKPSEIPSAKWLKKGHIYTVIKIQPLLSSKQLGFELEEIELGEECFPYFYFCSSRFAECDKKIMDSLMEEVKEIFTKTFV